MSDRGELTSADELALRRLEIFVGLGKFVAGTLVLGVFSLLLSNQIDQQRVDLLELQRLGELVDVAVTENPATRQRLAVFFAVISSSESAKERWEAFEDLAQEELDAIRIESDRIAALQAELEEEQITSAGASTDSINNLRTDSIINLRNKQADLEADLVPQLGAWSAQRGIEFLNEITGGPVRARPPGN